MNKDVKITDAEYKVLDVLWKLESANSKTIVDEVEKIEHWNRKTVHTLLKRLVEKGAVDAKKEGSIYIYSPLIDKGQYTKSQSESFLERIYNGSLSKFLTNFVDGQEISQEELDELYRILDSKKKGNK